MVDYETISRVFEIYTWVVAAIIVAFIGGIGLFYQKKFKVNTHYYLFLIPLLFLIVALTSTQIFNYETIYTEVAELLSGLMALILTAKLYLHMTEGD
ncbi:MAG: hypothetical protein P1P69_02255 [Methanosarcinaceae archaeon]|nr:hypothetical protein [Methanosarcinaceae archaeon]MDF1533310.1 hypothetical protein [Methanosarcinaceae archaeon]